MDSNERRSLLINILKEANRPIKGNELAENLKVSRQVIVQDIALMRAKGRDIIATPQGYIIYSKNNMIEHQIKCKNHKDSKELYDELKIIVDMGGTVKDVIVNHPTYGEIRADLNISSARDINEFMEKVENDEFKQLSSLTKYEHVHTIEASREDIVEYIIKELKEKNILVN